MTIGMEAPTIARTHKGQGIASFVIGMLSAAAVMGLIGVVAIAQIKTGKPEELTSENALIFGLGLLSVVFVVLVGIGFGIFGAADRASKKMFPTLGLVVNVGMLALFAAAMVFDPPTGTQTRSRGPNNPPTERAAVI